jgi:hypothetical protein
VERPLIAKDDPVAIRSNTPPASKRAPGRALGIAIAILSLVGLAIILIWFSSVTPVLAAFALAALSIVNIYSSWQLLRNGGAQSSYVMSGGTVYPVLVAILAIGGAAFAIIYTERTAEVTMIGIYLIILATALRGLYEKPRS